MSGTFDNVQLLVDTVAAADRQLTVTELATTLNRQLGVDHLDGDWVATQIGRSGGQLSVGDDGLVRASAPTRTAVALPAHGRALRLVAVDFETLPRHRPDGTVERVPLQAGAVRFGHDHSWAGGHAGYEQLVDVDAQLAELHPDHRLLARAATDGRALHQVGADLAAVLTDADMVVAYHGTEVDIPVLTQLLRHAGTDLDQLGVAPVDALYLAHTLLPDRQPVTVNGHRSSAHTLEAVAHRLGHPVAQTHTALADCQLLVEVCQRLAGRYRQLPDAGRQLLAAMTRNSDAFTVLHDLAEPASVRPAVTAAAARTGVDQLLADLPPLRGDTSDPAAGVGGPGTDPPHDPAMDGDASWPAGAGPPPLQVGDDLRTNGHTDPYLLARLLNPDAHRRPAQERTAALVADAVQRRRDTLVEAPTGSGKSLVLLAAALDWLAGGDDRRAVISTYTRALQAQLAGDLERLAGHIDGLGGNVDLVKGATNRLSLRALRAACVGLSTGAPHRAGLSTERASDGGFQELVAYLLLRLAAIDVDSPLTVAWTARSVDTDDLPAVFDAYTDGRLPGLLTDLSQGRAGDYPPDDHTPLAVCTVKVREALTSRRLVVANHALLCSAASVFTDLSAGHDLLLLADEAHELEHAATSTLSATIGTRQLERLRSDVVALARDVDAALGPDGRGGDGQGDELSGAGFVAAAGRLHEVIDDEALPQTLAAAFGVRAGTDLSLSGRTRQVTVAETAADLGQLRTADRLEPVVRLLAGITGSLLHHFEPATRRLGGDRADERATVHARLVDAHGALTALAADLAEILGHDAGDRVPDGPPAVGGPDGEVDPVPAGQGSNRLVWADEQPLSGRELAGFLDAGMRLRFWPVRLTTTPIAVANDARFAAFRAAFTVTVFVSGTLALPGADEPFAFIRDRLGLADVDAHTVTSDFDPARQALLVALSDFPSWAEQTDAAVASVAWQVDRYARATVTDDGRHGALVLTTSRQHAGQIAEQLSRHHRGDDRFVVHDAILAGNRRAIDQFRADGGVLVGTRGLWQGVDVPADRLRLVWITKLPFPPVGDPVLECRRARVVAAAAEAGDREPEQTANETFYLPLAAMALRQAVGRLLRSHDHRGVVIISDAKLAGDVRLRRTYRRFFLASLPGFATDDGTGELGAGNVTTMEDAWRRIWGFLGASGHRGQPPAITGEQLAALTTPQALRSHVWLPHTRRVIDAMLTDQQVAALRADGRFEAELLERAREVGGALTLSDGPLPELRDAQQDAVSALAAGDDVLALLPTGYGKSFLFQLPGLILPGVTLVVSPLVSLMTDQALKLNRTVGGRVRALTGTMAESNSRLGKAQVHQQLTGTDDHGIKLVYLSPERFASTQFQALVRAGVQAGTVRRIAFDEAHTLAAWGDTFRPDIRRAEHFIRTLRADHGGPQLLAVTATATRSVRRHLARQLFDRAEDELTVVQANPIRADMAVYKRVLATRGTAGDQQQALLVERLLDVVDGHAIVYATTVKEVERLHGYLAAQLGRRRRVLKYHGQLGDLERASVSDYFSTAPTVDDPDGFEPLVVVATKAFGLGIDRPDIRLVVAASPPGDLAELYQALGRAGRDQADRDPAEATTPTHGVALLTPSAWSTLRFFNRYDRDNDRLIRRFVDAFLSGDPPLDLDQLVGGIIDDRVTRGQVSPRQASRYRDRLEDTYRSLAVRTFAALAAAGAIDDLGNAPVRVTVTGTDRTGDERSDAARQARRIAQVVDDTEARDGIALTELYARLDPAALDGIGDVASLWFELLAFHAAGLLEVSQQANIGHGTVLNYRATGRAVDHDVLVDELSRLHHERAEDLRLLHEWFTDDDHCALDGIAEYFTIDQWDRGACDHHHTRCSVCWDLPAQAGTDPGPVLTALRTDTRTLTADADRVARLALRRLDRAVIGLLADHPNGAGARKLEAALKGEVTLYSAGRMQDLPWGLRRSRHFAQVRTVTRGQLQAALDRLVRTGDLAHVSDPAGRFSWYQHPRHVAS